MLAAPEAARQDLLRFLPSELPARLKEKAPQTSAPAGEPATPQTPVPDTPSTVPPRLPTDRRRLVWSFIRHAPSLPAGGREVGARTAAIEPWPHQVRAFERLYSRWPPRLLIADEVGLGKTIQAGLLLRQAWLAGRAPRILILAPKAVLKQWQIELREKFNLNWPIYDEDRLVRYPSRALRGRNERKVDALRWHEEPAVLASSQLMRRKERAAVLLEQAEPWDLVLLDEAHHARRRAAGSPREGGPNALLRLMRALKSRTQGLILLTATPMQVHPIEVWDLLDLLGLPPDWTETAFLGFFDEARQPNPSAEALDRMARLFQAVERHHGEATRDAIRRLTGLSRLKSSALLRALRDEASIPRRRLGGHERRAAVRVMLAHTPIRRLISRHTRELLRRYAADGVLSSSIADRRVQDRFVAMSEAERSLYDAVDDYVSTTYNRAAKAERSAVGFVMTIYRRRLASSFAALSATLSRRRQKALESTVALPVRGERRAAFEHPRIPSGIVAPRSHSARLARHAPSMHPAGRTPERSWRHTDFHHGLEEDAPDEDALDEVPDLEELGALESRALAVEEQDEIDGLLEQIGALPPDSKLARLAEALDELRRDGYDQIMVFTQYTDTMDFLRGALRDQGCRLLCFSGRGGETPVGNRDEWRLIDRDQVKRRFRDGDAELLLCTDAAAEGLNFQFCGALVNYDMPWNPMRVEQRIGRIDRVGQRHAVIRVVNLHYKETVETAVYGALRDRIGLFERVVGRLQPILARMPREIADAVLAGGSSPDARNLADRIRRQVSEEEQGGFDIDAALDTDLSMPVREPSPVTLDDLDRVIRDPDLMPADAEVQPLGPREYGLLAPGMAETIRVTTDAAYYEENSESVELWSPGNPFFKAPEMLPDDWEPDAGETLKDLLER